MIHRIDYKDGGGRIAAFNARTEMRVRFCCVLSRDCRREAEVSRIAKATALVGLQAARRVEVDVHAIRLAAPRYRPKDRRSESRHLSRWRRRMARLGRLAAQPGARNVRITARHNELPLIVGTGSNSIVEGYYTRWWIILRSGDSFQGGSVPAGDGAQEIEAYCRGRGLVAPAALATAHRLNNPELSSLLYRPGLERARPPSLEWATETINDSPWPLPRNLVPLLPVDDESFACVVAAPDESPDLAGAGAVVRWHMGVQQPAHQAALLDTGADQYARSVASELRARPIGLTRMLDEIGPAYEVEYLDQDRRPRDHVVRPVRLACQNVIVGLAAIAHDPAIDGMTVVAWQTCEVAHVGTHEGNRALAALMLCDAFQSGGTMEIRFDRPTRIQAEGKTKSGRAILVDAWYAGHPEMSVPASLRRFGRTRGVELGQEDPGCISPAEARDLFLAVTPMPPDLADRLHNATAQGVATPERLCFTLLSQTWREIEVDFMLAVSDRTGSILEGGASWRRRSERQAESWVARAAIIVGMLFRRLDTRDAAGENTEARVVEDNRVGVQWEVGSRTAAITFRGLDRRRVPWQPTDVEFDDGSNLTVLPRGAVTDEDLQVAAGLRQQGLVALAVPADAEVNGTPEGVLVLRCPDRLGELDLQIEARLLRSRTARA